MQITYRLNIADPGFCSPELRHEPHSAPQLLLVSFDDDSAQAKVARLLPLAWRYLPPKMRASARESLKHAATEDTEPDTVNPFLQLGQLQGFQAVAALPHDPEQSSVHSAWRDEVYHHWNHVFYDAAQFLSKTFHSLAGVGHFHPPHTEAFGLHFQAGHEEPVKKTCTTDVLICRAHQQAGTSLTMSVWGPNQTLGQGGSAAFCVFPETKEDVLYVRRGTEVSFSIHAPHGTSEGGGELAAVVVCAIMCSDSHYGGGTVRVGE